MNSKAFYKLTYGLYIISVSDGNENAGCVVNTLAQVTSSPAQLSVTINKNNYTTQLIDKTKQFSGIALSINTPINTIANFGFSSSKDKDKFADFQTNRDSLQNIYPTESAIAQYSCKVVQQVDLGTHIMFIGEVVDANVLADEEPLTYAYYQTVKKGTTPKNAPSYQEKQEATGFKCTICNYILESDNLPTDYICPICKATAEKFIKL